MIRSHCSRLSPTVGRGRGDRDARTCVWDAGTRVWDAGLGDARTGMWGRVYGGKLGHGDMGAYVGTWGRGDVGTRGLRDVGTRRCRDRGREIGDARR